MSSEAVIHFNSPPTYFALELQSVKGRKIKDGLTVQKEYEVSFKVFPSVFNDGCYNVLHFTTGVNSGKLGSRIPGVWFCTGDSKSQKYSFLRM